MRLILFRNASILQLSYLCRNATVYLTYLAVSDAASLNEPMENFVALMCTAIEAPSKP